MVKSEHMSSQSEHTSTQIWCQKIFSLPKGGRGGPKKVAQDDMKHILVLEFWKSDHFVGGGGGVFHQKVNRHTPNQTDRQTNNQTYGHYSE